MKKDPTRSDFLKNDDWMNRPSSSDYMAGAFSPRSQAKKKRQKNKKGIPEIWQFNEILAQNYDFGILQLCSNFDYLLRCCVLTSRNLSL